MSERNREEDKGLIEALERHIGELLEELQVANGRADYWKNQAMEVQEEMIRMQVQVDRDAFSQRLARFIESKAK